MKNMDIKIGIAYHKKFDFQKSDIFIPIQVGAALNNQDLGIQKDSDGDNISKDNAYCSEMSATYWLWKNYTADYKGLFHYRRFLTFKKQSPFKRWKNILLYVGTKFASPFIKDSWIKYFAYPNFNISETQVTEYLEAFERDLINGLSKTPADLYCCGYMYHSTYSVKTHLQRAIGHWHSEYIKKMIADEFPEFNDYFVQTLKSNKFVGFNMIVAKNEIYNDYCSIMFGILSKYHEYMNANIPANVVNNALLRDSGYIAELITDAYIRMLKEKGANVCHIGCINVDVNLGGMSYKKIRLTEKIKSKL